MQEPDCRRERARKVATRTRSLLKEKAALIAILVMLTVSILYLAYQSAKVVDAISVWSSPETKAQGHDAVVKALHVVNDEEMKLISPVALTALFSAAAFRIADLKIVPRKCFYCNEWVHGRNARQSPDKAFHYHEQCEPKEGRLPKP